MSKFKKTAQLGALVGELFGAPGTAKGPMDWVNELLNPEALTKNAVFFAALFQNLKTRYNPTAFYHVLEMDKSRGYEARDPYTGAVLTDPMTGDPMRDKYGNPYVFQASQGHLEKEDYNAIQNELNTIPATKGGKTTFKQFSELYPQSDMPDFVKRNITVNEDSPEYKDMFKKLYPGVPQPPKAHTNATFIKVGQAKKDNNDAKTQDIKKLMPSWDIKTMIDDLDKIAQIGSSQGLPKDQINLQIQNKLRQYQESVKPLHEYLVKNGYGQKTS